MHIERIKLLAKDILYYGIGNMLYSLVQFFSMPLVVKNMSMSEVANLNILLPTGVMLSAIVTFGMDSAMVRFIRDTDNKKEKITIFSTGFLFECSLALITCSLLWVYSEQVCHFLKIDSSKLPSSWMLLCWLPGVVIGQYCLNWFKYNFQRSLFLINIAMQSVIYLVIIIYLDMSVKVSLNNVVLALCLSNWFVAIVGLLFCKKMLSLKINRTILIKLIAYGLPFMLLAFGFNLIFSIDRYILVGKISQDEFSVYTQAFRIAAIFSMIVSSFNFAFGPFSLSLLDKPDASYTFACIHTYYLMVMSIIGISFIALSRVIITALSGAEYLAGNKYIPLFVMGYMFYGLYSFAQLGIINSQKSYLGLYALGFGTAIGIGTDLLLVDRLNGYGTAIGFVLANIVMVLVANVFSRKYLIISFNFIKDILIILMFSLFGFVFVENEFLSNIYADSGLKLIPVLLITSCIFYFKVQRKNLKDNEEMEVV